MGEEVEPALRALYDQKQLDCCGGRATIWFGSMVEIVLHQISHLVRKSVLQDFCVISDTTSYQWPENLEDRAMAPRQGFIRMHLLAPQISGGRLSLTFPDTQTLSSVSRSALTFPIVGSGCLSFPILQEEKPSHTGSLGRRSPRLAKAGSWG